MRVEHKKVEFVHSGEDLRKWCEKYHPRYEKYKKEFILWEDIYERWLNGDTSQEDLIDFIDKECTNYGRTKSFREIFEEENPYVALHALFQYFHIGVDQLMKGDVLWKAYSELLNDGDKELAQKIFMKIANYVDGLIEEVE